MHMIFLLLETHLWKPVVEWNTQKREGGQGTYRPSPLENAVGMCENHEMVPPPTVGLGANVFCSAHGN